MSAPTATAPVGQTDTDASAPRRPRRKLLFIGIVVAVLLAGAASYVLVLGPDAAADEAVPVVEEGAVIEVGTLTTNLAGTPAQYARVGVALVLSADADQSEVTARFPLVKDAAIAEIGRHAAASLQGEEGLEPLRRGLTERIQAVYPDGEVVRIALTELLVQ
ncbi:MAG: flagellar basal body-associated FliL family protein [Nitriliruptor sp.]|uniref:flagellar basal body-associated protein FliL n=1 Tax=Nitriliruptor sp. TaxID=2448056 RepID=UPI00349FFC5C